MAPGDRPGRSPAAPALSPAKPDNPGAQSGEAQRPRRSAPDEAPPVFGVQLGDLLLAVDVRLIEGVRVAAAQVVAAVAEVAGPAAGVQRLLNDLNPLLACGVLVSAASPPSGPPQLRGGEFAIRSPLVGAKAPPSQDGFHGDSLSIGKMERRSFSAQRQNRNDPQGADFIRRPAAAPELAAGAQTIPRPAAAPEFFAGADFILRPAAAPGSAAWARTHTETAAPPARQTARCRR